jgi:hypothetical protein
MGSLRLRQTSTTLFLLLFALFAESAFATHFKYGTMYWIRDLAFSEPGFVKVKLVMETGWRWGFPFTTVVPAGTTAVPAPDPNNACAGTPVVGDVPAGGSCPPVGRYVNLNGGGTGILVFDKPITVTKLHGVPITPFMLNGPCTWTSTSAPPIVPCSITADGRVTTVLPTLDTMYAYTEIEFKIAVSSLPLRVTYRQAARISTLRDSNNDQPWQLETRIDLSAANAGVTRSPQSTSFPLIPVNTGVPNTVSIPSVAFDNLINRYRIATPAESLLITAKPANLSLNASTGIVNFTPPADGHYAVQFIVESFDNATPSLVRAMAPLDLMFHAAPGAAKTVSLATGDGLTTYTATVRPPNPPPTPFTFTVRSTLDTPDTAYIGTINHTPLPAGATFTTPVCNGGGACVGTFSWTPTVNSTSSVVCFGASYNNNGLVATSTQQLCVNINLAPLATTLVAFEELDGAAGGGPLTLKARLTRTLDGAPLPERPVVFSFVGDPNNPPWVRVPGPHGLDTAMTDPQGFASLNVTSTRAVPTPAPYSATFNAVANEFLESSSAVSVVSSKLATTSLNAPTTGTTPFPSVGHPLPVSVVLNRIFTDGGLFGVGAIVDVTLTPPTGAPTVAFTTPTNTSGKGVATFPPPTTTGVYTATAFFAGNDALFGNVMSPPTAINVRQRTQVTMSAGIASQNVPSQVQALLVAVPSNTPLANRTVKFSAAGITDVLVQTDANGVASALLAFATVGARQVTASYAPITATELNRSGFESADSSSASVDVQPAQNTAITIAAFTGISGQGATLTATLKTAANAPVQGATIDFSIVGGGSLGSGITLADGTVSVAITPGNAFSGQYRADFAGMAGFAPSNATSSYLVNKATTSLAPLNVNVTEFVGDTLMVTTTLTRTDPPAGPLGSQTVTFTLTGGLSATTQTIDATTDVSGHVSASFVLTARGQFHLTANFASTAALNTSSSNADLAVYQKTSLLLNAPHGVAGDVTTLNAALTTVPGGVPIVGETVVFTVNGMSISATTNTVGVASASTTFAAAGTFPASAQFSNVASYYADQVGLAVPTSSSAVAAVDAAHSHVANVTAPATALVGQSIAMSTVVTRTSSPAGPIVNAPVTFTVAGPGGSTELSATTNALGQASASYLPTQGGIYGVTATFLGDAAHLPFTSAAVSTTVTHPTTMAVSPVTGFAGRPLTVTATLLSNPGNWGVAGQNVTFTFTGTGAPAPVQGTTDGSGVATVAPVFTTPGAFTATASFSNASSFFGDSSASAAVVATNTAPTITDLPNVNLPATSSAGRHIDFTSTGNDAEDGALTPVCNASSGMFPIGSTNVSCTVTDIVGATATDTFTITITNNAPTFTAPTNVTLPATSPQGRQVTFSALGSDTEDGSLTADCQTRSGETFPLGTTIVACTVTDVAGATASGSFSITITNSAPTIVDLPDVSEFATSAAGRHVDFVSAGDDNEDGALTGFCTANPGTFPIGTTDVTCTVTDVAGATASDSFSITIKNNAPTFAAPDNISLPATSPQGRQVTFSALGSDIEDGSLTADCQVRSGETFPLGTTTIACTVIDSVGLTASDSFDVVITNTAPTIVDLPDLTGEATSAAGRSMTFDSSGDDAEDGALTPVCTSNPGTFPIGATPVTCTVTDVAGFTASDSFTVTVQDTTKPDVSASSITVEQTSPAGAVGDYAFSASDIVDGTLTPTCTPASGTTFARGATEVTCTATDAHNNTGSATATVTVQDTIKPVVTYSGNAASYTADQVVNITCVATDSGSGVATTTCANISGPAHTFAVGANNFSANATDVAGNTNSAAISFTVTVPASAVGNVITQFFDSPAEAAKASHTLGQATSAPNANARAAHLNKLVNDIEKEIGKTITAAEAATLIALIQNLY